MWRMHRWIAGAAALLGVALAGCGSSQTRSATSAATPPHGAGAPHAAGNCDHSLNLFPLVLVEVYELYAESLARRVMANFAFNVKPVVIRQHHTKAHNLAAPDFAYGVQKASTFGKIGYARSVFARSAVPNRIQTDAQSWFCPSVILHLQCLLI